MYTNAYGLTRPLADRLRCVYADGAYSMFSYMGKSVGSYASVKESMRTAVRFPMAAYFKD